MKKLLSVLLVGLFTAVGSFASANCLDNGLSSDSDLTDISSNANSMGTILMYPKNGTLNGYVCVIQDVEGNTVNGATNITYYNNNKVVCSDSVVNSFMYEFTSPINSYSIYSSSSPIIYVSSCSSAGGSDSDSLLNPGVISSGVQNGVSAFTGGFGNLLPTLILFGLYIAVIYWGWDIIRSRLKHIFVVDKPSIDDVTNCQLRLDENGNPVHQIDLNGKEYVYIEGFDRYIEKDDKFASYVNENLDFDYKAYAKNHYDEFRSVNTENSPYYRGGEYDENTAYRDFMHFEYQAGIDYEEAVHNWNNDKRKGLSYFDRVDRAYYDYKYSKEYDD